MLDDPSCVLIGKLLLCETFHDRTDKPLTELRGPAKNILHVFFELLKPLRDPALTV